MSYKQPELSRSTIASLQEVMLYENPEVVDRFRNSWDVSIAVGNEIFQELKHWLWLCAFNASKRVKGEKVPSLAITHSMTLLDEMWHAFILFTKPYAAFCDEYFGFYIHHGPTSSAEKEKAKKQIELDPEKYLSELEKDLTVQYEYIYEHLGEATLQKWYSEWTDLYTTEQLNKLYKKKW